jgi:hypothetical protein
MADSNCVICLSPSQDILQPVRVRATEHAIIESLKCDPLACKLALGIFVSVQAQFGIEGKVPVELEKERAPPLYLPSQDGLVFERSTYEPRSRFDSARGQFYLLPARVVASA